MNVTTILGGCVFTLPKYCQYFRYKKRFQHALGSRFQIPMLRPLIQKTCKNLVTSVSILLHLVAIAFYFFNL